MTTAHAETVDSHQPEASVHGRWHEIADSVYTWQLVAVAAMLATAGGVALTQTVDLCSPPGHALLYATYLIAPPIALASIFAVATNTNQRLERYLISTVAIVLTAAWLFALTWASIGQALQGTAC